MSSQAIPSSLVLIRRLADGKVEWVPLQSPAQHMPVAPDAAYTLLDRAAYEAPQTLVAQRRGEDLVIEVQGTEALVLEGFFTAAHAAFYPTTNIAGGAGPFSGPALTPDSSVLAGSAGGEQVVWSAERDDDDKEFGSGTPASGATAGTAAAPNEAGGGSAMLWVGLAAGGLGLAALAGGGGGSGGGSSGGGSVPPPPDTVAPQITSGGTASPIAENSGAGQVVYTATATDAGAVTYSLKAGADASAFSINASSGAVTLTGNPDFETKSSYNFTVVATDAANNSAEQAVNLAIGNVADTPVTITSGTTAAAIAENSGAGQVVYTATATATSGESVTYSLKAVGDAAAFSINATTGAVTLAANPNYEAKSSYNFTVVATDATNNAAEQAIGLVINNLDEVAPTITSGATAAAINENSGAGQVVYTVTSTDTGDISTGNTTYSLKAGGDATAFSINANTGAVTLTGNPNHEAKSSYTFTVVARDAAGNSSERAVTLAINDLDDSAPTITSGATATAINENSGAGQVIYTVTSTDNGDISTGSTTYSLKHVTDFASFSINASTGAVTLTANPDDEAKGGYNFTVVATDAAGNSSERAVSLGINDLDEVAPTITSAAMATAIVENSGPHQVVYTVTSTDTADISTGSTTYSLKAGGDSAAFSINANSGVVRLTANPDFEAKSSYTFTVVATDAAGNFSERAVTLPITDVVDETPPGVNAVAITGAVGAQNGVLNAGDTVSVTVTMTENTQVDTSGGTPSIELSIGGDRVDANYVSGSGTSDLVFEYTIQPGEDDSNGISIRPNTLALNGGSITDLAGNAANLGHGSVGSNPSFIVDTTSPTLSSSTPADNANDVAQDVNIVLTFSEDMQTGSGNVIISSGFDTRTINVTDGSQVSVSGSQVTVNPTFALILGTSYSVRVDSGAFTDDGGNPYAGVSNDTTLNFQIADFSLGTPGLMQVSSSGSSRVFQSPTNEPIDIRVASNETASTVGGDSVSWGSSANFGTDDRVTLAGSGVHDPSIPANPMSITEAAWQSLIGSNSGLLPGDSLANSTQFAASLPDAFHQVAGQPNIASFEHMPAVVLTSQGLA